MQRVSSQTSLQPLRIAFLSCAFALTAVLFTHSHALARPVLTKDTGDPICKDALALANATFYSKSFHLSIPQDYPNDFHHKLVLHPTNPLCYGDCIAADNVTFGLLPKDVAVGQGIMHVRHDDIYYSKTTIGGKQIIITYGMFNYLTEYSNLFLVNESASIEDGDFRKDPSTSVGTTALSDLINPPHIFQDKQSGGYWAMDTGFNDISSSDWRVYALDPTGIRETCVISFNEQRQSKIFPKSVRQFLGQIRHSVGKDGNMSGTSNPVLFTLRHASYVVFNAALRPWAIGQLRTHKHDMLSQEYKTWNEAAERVLSAARENGQQEARSEETGTVQEFSQPYNTREEVDQGLGQWARPSKWNADILAKIQRLYPIAERDLAAYYVKHFSRSPEEARDLAAYMLDLIYRNYYSFPAGSEYFRLTTRKNPWKDH